MRLLMIAYHYPPGAAAGSHRSARFARLLPELGWNVEVLTVRLAARGAPPVDPAGVRTHRTRAFHGIDGLLSLRRRRRNAANTAASRGPVTAEPGDAAGSATQSAGRWQRFKDTVMLLIRFPDTEAGWIPSAVARGLILVLRTGPDALLTSGPPHSSHLIGLILKRLTGRPWVADLRDPWSVKPWIQDWERREWRSQWLRRLEGLVVRSADRVVLNTDEMREDFVARYPDIDPTRFRAIPNGFDSTEFDGLAARPRERGPFRLTHAGSFYRRRSPVVLLDAIRRLVDDGAIQEGQLELELIGPIVLDGVSLAGAVNARRLGPFVRHVPSLPHRDALLALLEADALLIVQPDAPTQVPGKLYEYLYVGKPVVAVTHPGATADLIAAGRLGWVASPDRVDQVADAILTAVRTRDDRVPDPSARHTLLARHDVRALAAELAAVLRECTHASEATARG
jgi:glycosyltransferase involved in cell wall biosynthesis